GFNHGTIGTAEIRGQTTLGVGDAFKDVPSLMSTVRFFHTATLVAGGKVLLAGGAAANSGVPLSSVELYNPVANTFNLGSGMSSPRARHTATLLASGSVLMVGGSNGSSLIASAEVY